ncbi:hypothetical protein [Streptomyces mirabilis]|uniref:hypothetical protein n=1 Tax=Streptomyces mirabilis TaxID=68239 RepID=UPI0038133B63
MALRSQLIGYDLNRPGQDYKDLIEAIKELANGYWHHLDSTWIIRTEKSTSEVRNALKGHIDSGDELLVIDVSGDLWATAGMSESANDWLRKYV